MGEMDRVNLREVLDKISDNTIVLPDFQRGFTWKEKSRQIALLASVLTRLPIGTVLFLEVNSEDYGCKKIGKNERNIECLQGKREVKALLDGQQRITVLMAFFSTKLQEENIEDLISPSLARRYFLNVPSFEAIMEQGEEDIFGGSILKFPNAFKGDYPEISSEEMRSRISFVVQKKKFLYEEVNSRETRKMCKYCRDVKNSAKENAYLVPLFYLLEASDEKSAAYTILKDVLKEIGKEYEEGLKAWFQSEKISVEKKKKHFKQLELEEELNKQFMECLGREGQCLPKAIEEILQEKRVQWSQDFYTYLTESIKNIRLYEIKVGVKDKERAIDIYENLNLGGKSLSVFDLILAKASKHADEIKQGNLFKQIVEYIEQDHRAEYEKFIELCENNQQNIYQNYILKKDIEYSASYRIGCWDNDKKELSTAYIKALMNLLGIIDYFSEQNLEQTKGELKLRNETVIRDLRSKVVKKEYLLQIDSENINGYILKACEGLDRASAFLQIRCGIRKVSEINYNLMWVILGTVFLNEEWFHNRKILNYMEAWYWSAILSGEFKSEQNRVFVHNLTQILLEINSMDTEKEGMDFVKGLCNGVLKDHKFADKNILLMKNPSVIPEEVISNTICQYYLSRIYKDILKEIPGQTGYTPQELSALNDDIKLEKHHLMPVGSIEAKFKDMNKKGQERRKDRENLYNSPLNYLFVSSNANLIILNNTLKSYFGYCDSATLQEVGVEKESFEKVGKEKMDYYIQNDELEMFLEKRYRKLTNSLTLLFRNLLNDSEIQCGETEEKML